MTIKYKTEKVIKSRQDDYVYMVYEYTNERGDLTDARLCIK